MKIETCKYCDQKIDTKSDAKSEEYVEVPNSTPRTIAHPVCRQRHLKELQRAPTQYAVGPDNAWDGR
jgi:hypothetical protein